jgi:hypothetical protein
VSTAPSSPEIVLQDVDRERIDAAFEVAVTSFTPRRHALVSGGDPASVMQGRDRARSVRDLADLEALLCD